MSGMTGDLVRRWPRRRRMMQVGVLVGIVVVGGVGAGWYRATYYVWPGQGAGARMHWCGRNYDVSTDPRVPLAVARVAAGPAADLRGSYPPLGPRQRVFATAPSAGVGASRKTCPTVVYLRNGSGSYRAYGLSGGN
jgi:hypothetical protein